MKKISTSPQIRHTMKRNFRTEKNIAKAQEKFPHATGTSEHL
jgi:hypothetical protein